MSLQIAWQNHPWVLSYQTELTQKLQSFAQVEHQLWEEGANADLVVKQFEVEKDAHSLSTAIFFPREDMRAVLVALDEQVHLENFTRTFHFATDSEAMRHYLCYFFPQVSEVSVIDFAKEDALKCLQAGKYDGIFTHYGVGKRLGWANYVVQKMNVFAFLPQVGAATLLIQANHPSLTNTLLSLLQHHPTQQAILAELSFYTALEPHTTATPFVFSTLFQGTLTLTGGIIDAAQHLHIQATNEDTQENAILIGKKLAAEIVAQL